MGPATPNSTVSTFSLKLSPVTNQQTSATLIGLKDLLAAEQFVTKHMHGAGMSAKEVLTSLKECQSKVAATEAKAVKILVLEASMVQALRRLLDDSKELKPDKCDKLRRVLSEAESDIPGHALGVAEDDACAPLLKLARSHLG